MKHAWLRLLLWPILVAPLFLSIPGCGGVGAGRTMNAAQRVDQSDPLFATKTLQNAHKNYRSRAR